MPEKPRSIGRLYPSVTALTIALAVALALPAGLPAAEPPGGEGEVLLKYEEAVRTLRQQGRAQEAATLLESLVQMHPKSAYADDALLELGRARMALKDPKGAVAALERLLDGYPSSPARGRAFLELGRAWAALGKWKDCVDACEGALAVGIAPEDRAAALSQRAACLLGKGRPLDAARDAMESLRLAAAAEASQGAAQTLLAAARSMDEGDLGRLLAASDGSEPFGFLALADAERALSRGERDAAAALLMDALVHHPERSSDPLVAQLWDRTRPAGPSRGEVVGAVLPLSGRYRVYGEKALQGIQAALGFLSPLPRHRSSVDFRLVVRDSAADPALAAQAVKELAQEDQAVAVIGPIFSRTTRAAAEEAERNGLPMISLSADPAVPALGEHVFRRGLTDAQQVEALAGLALDRLGMRRCALLYPDSSYGREMANLFWNAVERRGGRVTASEIFPAGQADYGPQIRALARLNRKPSPEEQARLAADPKAELEPIVDFDVLFVPADFQTVGLLAPQLAFYEVTEVLLLGTEAWNSPWLTELGEQYVEGAVFAAGFVPGAAEPAAREMEERFFLSFGEVPQSLAVQAYDAALIVRRAVESGQARDRAAMRSFLATLDRFPGAEGPLTADTEGDLVQRPSLLTVESGRVVPLVLVVD